MLYSALFAVAIVVFIGTGIWYFRLRREQTGELTLEVHGPVPPVRAVLDKSRNDEFNKLHHQHRTRCQKHGERISDEDARELVGLYFDLDLSWRNPEIAHNYNVQMYARLSLIGRDGNPREDIEAITEGSHTNPVHWDALEWTFARTEGKRPLGQALHRWVRDVMRDRCPRPKGGKMAERNDVIRWAVYVLTGCGMNATRNELTERTSACDIVAGVLDERGHPVRRYNSVLAIWQGKR